MNVYLTAEQKKNKEKQKSFYCIYTRNITPHGLNKRRLQFAKLEFENGDVKK